MNYRQAIDFIKSRRKNQLLAQEQRLIAALKNDAALRELDIKIRSLKFQDDKKNSALLDYLIAEENKILDGLGIDLNPPPFCQICFDTGIKNGKHCSCVISMSAGESDYTYTFDNCDFSVFNASDLPTVKNAYDKMRLFCEKFPATNKTNILLCGNTGTGKTFLATCVASFLSAKGFSVIFMTAFEFVNKMLLYHTSPIDDKLEHLNPILDCDMLIIDDLGSENIMKNVTVEYFYNVINERLRRKRHTLITTNLDDALIESRYGMRVASRLFDKRTCLGFALANTDIRKSGK